MKTVALLACFALWLAAAACSTRPLASGRDGGSGGADVTGTDAPTAPDAPQGTDAPTGADARRDVIERDLAEVLACAADGDCVASGYPQSVASIDDCYCAACALWPLNTKTNDANAASWQQYCQAWQASATCPLHSCPASPRVRCVAGLCKAGSYVVPQLCPVDPVGGCPEGVPCAGGCCKRGEWCDDQIGCRCASGLACLIGQACGNAPQASGTPGRCGNSCCFDCAP